jgi:hypothetical protein
VKALVLSLRWAHKVVFNKFYVDELYDLIIVRPLRGLAVLCHRVIDAFVIDLVIVNGSAWAVDFLGRGAKRLQSGDVQRYLVAILVGVAAIVFFGSRPAASFTAPAKARVGAPWQPDASALLKSGRDLTFAWDFDGKRQFRPLSARPAPHTFQQAGKHRVTLQVCDKSFGTRACREAVKKVEVTP